MVRLRVVALALAALFGLAAKPNVVLITADTLRADHLGSYGYFRATSPALDRLAADAVVFDTVYVPMATTLPSHTSIMTSTYPARHGIQSNLRFFHQPVKTTDSIRTAAQLFKAAGYHTAGFTSSSPLSEASGINAGFDTFVGPPPYETNDRRIDIRAQETTDRTLEWLQKVESPFFLWIHYFDPHDPYRPPDDFLGRFGAGPKLFEFLERTGVPLRYRLRAVGMNNRYDGEILYMDGQIARILERLKTQGLYDDAAIVFTADHGEGLGQHSYLRHSLVWNEQVLVPLIMKFPAAEQVPRRRHTDLACVVDILPTLVGGAGVPLETEQFDGVNLLEEKREHVLSQREARDIPMWPGRLYSLATLDWKYHHHTDPSASDLLYDLRADPYETRNVIAEHAERATRMREQMLRLIAENESKSPLRVLESLPDEILEQLRKLGYR